MFDANPGLTAIVKGMATALPAGFRRSGRKWIRTLPGGLRQEVHLYRLMFSYGLLGAIFRLNLCYGIDGQELQVRDYWAPLATGGSRRDWKIDGSTTDARLSEIIEEVRADLVGAVRFLEDVSTPDLFCDWLDRYGRPVDLLAAYTAFDRSSDAMALLDSGRLVRLDHRELALELADVVTAAYDALGVRPSAEWREFCERSVRAFRGRPPKKYRAMWQIVGDRLTSFAVT